MDPSAREEPRASRGPRDCWAGEHPESEEPRPALESDEPWETEEPDRLDSGPGPSPNSRARAVVVGAALAAAALLVGVVAVSGTVGLGAPEPESDLAPSQTQTQTPSQVDWPTPRPASPTPARPAVFSSSGFLADLDLDVFVRSNRAVFRIDTSAQRVTRTAVQGMEAAGPVSLLATTDRLILRPLDSGPGYAILDGQGPRPLSGQLTAEGQYFPGPGNRIWAVSTDGAGQSQARLTDAAGTRVEATVRAAGSGYFRTDGAGGLFYVDVGGSYRATVGGLRRVSPGTVMAASRDRFLTVECDERFLCDSYLYDRRADTRRRVGKIAWGVQSAGQISDDGRQVAVVRWTADGTPVLDVIDVPGGRKVGSIPLGAQDWVGEPPFAWLPDGRLVGLSSTRLFVFDPGTRETTRSPIRFPPLRQIAVRRPVG